MASLSSPRVALKADIGKSNSAVETVEVPGSDEGKVEMNCACSHWRFCEKWTSPAASFQIRRWHTAVSFTTTLEVLTGQPTAFSGANGIDWLEGDGLECDAIIW